MSYLVWENLVTVILGLMTEDAVSHDIYSLEKWDLWNHQVSSSDVERDCYRMVSDINDSQNRRICSDL